MLDCCNWPATSISSPCVGQSNRKGAQIPVHADRIGGDWGITNLHLRVLDAARTAIAERATRVIVYGNAGARQGWIEAPYRAVPCAPGGPWAVRAPTATRNILVILRGIIVMNETTLDRIYRDKGLSARCGRGRKRARGSRMPVFVPMRPNQRWSQDFLQDTFRACHTFAHSGGQQRLLPRQLRPHCGHPHLRRAARAQNAVQGGESEHRPCIISEI